MPAVSPVIVTDRASTPVATTLYPAGQPKNNGIWEFVSNNSIPVGRIRLTYNLWRTASGKYKAEMRFEAPVVVDQTVNGIVTPVVVRRSFHTGTLEFDERSTDVERDNVLGQVASVYSTAANIVNQSIKDLEALY